MKPLKYLLYMLPAVVMLLQVSCSQGPDTVQVMSYNIRLSLVDDGENHWNIRKPASIIMIDSLKPDVLGVQESVKEQVDYLVEHLPAYARVGVAREDGDSIGEFSAIFYLKDKYEVMQNGTFWLSETPDVPSFGWDAAHMRIVTWGKFRNRKTGRTFFAFNTHFDHRERLPAGNLPTCWCKRSGS